MNDDELVWAVGGTIRQYRYEKDWSQATLADRALCCKRTIENAESSRRVKAGTLKAIANALEISIDLILDVDRANAARTHGYNHFDFVFPFFEQLCDLDEEVTRHYCIDFDKLAAAGCFYEDEKELRERLPREEPQVRVLSRRLIIALHTAANHTLSYISRTKNQKNQRDRKEELALSDLWLDVAARFFELQENSNIRYPSSRFLTKARYWADIDHWTDEDIDKMGIRLTTLVRDSELALANHFARFQQPQNGTTNPNTRPHLDAQ